MAKKGPDWPVRKETSRTITSWDQRRWESSNFPSTSWAKPCYRIVETKQTCPAITTMHMDFKRTNVPRASQDNISLGD